MPSIQLLVDQGLHNLIDTGSNQPTDDNTVIIDVRGPNEHAREHIAGSINKSAVELHDCNEFVDQIVIFHCQAGVRTQQAQNKLESLACKQAYCMQGGLNQRKQCGFVAVVDHNAPLDIMCQMQIIAGSLMSISVILGFWLSSYFSLISLFVGRVCWLPDSPAFVAWLNF